MRIIVTGGRDYADAKKLFAVLDSIRPTLVMHGAYRGADTLADDWAKSRGVKCKPFPADWTAHKKQAGPIRNSRMIAEGADLVVAFPGGTGTADCVCKARAAGIEVLEVTL